MRKTLLAVIAIVLAACGDDGGGGDDTPDIDASTSDIDAGETALTCADYCTSVEAACAAPLDQWSSQQTCVDGCAAWAVGTAADTTGNTLGCRTYHAGMAVGNPDTHCVHAGPGGAGVCGANCEGFCTLALSACTGANEQFADMGECMTACATYDQNEPYDTTDTSGDTFACRLYHLTAAIGAPGTHCAHIVEASPTCN